jgi:hypothetical protein
MMSEAVSDLVTACHAHLRWDPDRGLWLEGRWVSPDRAVPKLRDHLYVHHFCRWQGAQPDPMQFAHRVSGDPNFVHALTRATCEAWYWDPDWTMVSAEERGSFARKDGIFLFVADPHHQRPSGSEPGSTVAVRIPCARPYFSPGFFYLIGSCGPIAKDRPHLRIYLNISSAAAPLVVYALLARFAPHQIPFEAKFANNPTHYGRVDPAVLYLSPEHLDRVRRELLELRAEQPDWFRPESPILTAPLAPGLAIAESPLPRGDAPWESYGHHRTRLLAEGLIEAMVAGRADPGEWVGAIARRFASEGLSLDEPYRQHLPTTLFRAPEAGNSVVSS